MYPGPDSDTGDDHVDLAEAQRTEAVTIRHFDHLALLHVAVPGVVFLIVVSAVIGFVTRQ